MDFDKTLLSVEKCHPVCVIKNVSLLKLEQKMVETETKANDSDESGKSPTPVN